MTMFERLWVSLTKSGTVQPEEKTIGEYTVYVDPRLVKVASVICVQVEAEVRNASPENKHARAFAKLTRIAPNHSGRDIALAIELALRKEMPR